MGGSRKLTMIHIKEKDLPGHVVISVAGTLDRESLPLLQEVCERHLASDAEVELDFSELVNICREGIEYLSGIRRQVSLRDLPGFIQESLQRHKLPASP